MKYQRFIPIILLFFTIFLSSCGDHKFGDQRKMESNVKDRVRKNIEEGRGVRFGSISPKSGGVFNFNTSNPLWQATIESLSFMPLSSADYGGGIIITDWYSSGDSKNEEIKITIRFTSNEIRADAVQIFYTKEYVK